MWTTLLLAIVFTIAIFTVIEMVYFRQLSKLQKVTKLDSSAFFTTEQPPDDAFKAVIQHVQSTGYRTDYFNQNNGILLLSKPFLTGLLSDGLSYQVQVVDRENSHTRVIVKVVPKALSFLLKHKKQTEFFLAEIEAAVFAAQVSTQEMEYPI